jgi:hypothetical protein
VLDELVEVEERGEPTVEVGVGAGAAIGLRHGGDGKWGVFDDVDRWRGLSCVE